MPKWKHQCLVFQGDRQTFRHAGDIWVTDSRERLCLHGIQGETQSEGGLIAMSTQKPAAARRGCLSSDKWGVKGLASPRSTQGEIGARLQGVGFWTVPASVQKSDKKRLNVWAAP